MNRVDGDPRGAVLGTPIIRLCGVRWRFFESTPVPVRQIPCSCQQQPKDFAPLRHDHITSSRNLEGQTRGERPQPRTESLSTVC